MMAELLLKLIERPDILSKEYSATFKQWINFCWGDANMIVSSANCRLETDTDEPGGEIPENRPLAEANFSILLKTSATRTKIKGERGSPCLNPLADLM